MQSVSSRAIQKRLIAKGLTILSFARMLGVTEATIKRWLHDKSIPQLKYRKKIEELCGPISWTRKKKAKQEQLSLHL